MGKKFTVTLLAEEKALSKKKVILWWRGKILKRWWVEKFLECTIEQENERESWKAIVIHLFNFLLFH
jgi:hypothetical protein